jgi:hypothetical protein
MAPEQGLGRDLTGSADQYALATTLYEALAGKPPFSGGTLVETILAKQRDPAPGVRDLAPEVPPASEAAIRRALDADPGRRFPSCAAFAEEVARPLAPAEAPAPSRARTAVFLFPALLAALLGVGLATGWFGLAKGTAPAVPEATGNSIVVLAEAGSVPRAVRRYRPTAGAVDRFTFHGTQGNRLDIPVPISPLTVRDQDVSLRVARVEEDGRFVLEWSLGAPRAGRGEGIPDGQVESEQTVYDAMGDFAGTSTLTARGEVLEARIEAKKELPPELARQVPAYADTLRAVEIVLPAEPIGVGAVWDVTSAASFLDMRYQQTTTFEVVSVEGTRLRLKFRTTTGAPPQTFHPPGAPEGTSVEIVSFRTAGEGTALIDVSRPYPVEWTAKQEIAFVFEIPSREGGPRKVTYSGTAESSIRRD